MAEASLLCSAANPKAEAARNRVPSRRHGRARCSHHIICVSGPALPVRWNAEAASAAPVPPSPRQSSPNKPSNPPRDRLPLDQPLTVHSEGFPVIKDIVTTFLVNTASTRRFRPHAASV